jgi:hypothetical protein
MNGGGYQEPLTVTRRIPDTVIASAAKQSIFRSNYLKEDGLPRPLRDLAMTLSRVKRRGSWY